MEQKKTTGLTMVFGLLLALTLGGILLRLFTGYNYPSTPATDFELNTLGDLYEAFILLPVGLIGLWTLRKGSPWGPLLIAGVAANLVYNYAMISMGRQNLWVFLWTAKVALSGTAICLVWPHLPSGIGRFKERLGTAIFLAAVGLIFAKLMGQRLLASATGLFMEMNMQGSGVVDWGQPALRDPIIFFSLAFPVLVTAILGLLRGTEWGARASALMNAYLVNIVSIVLFTGPLKEFLFQGSVTGPMWQMTVIFVLVAIPPVYFLIRLVKDETKPAADRKSKAI